MSAKRHERIAVGLNIAAVVFFFAGAAVIVGSVMGALFRCQYPNVC